VLENRLFDLDFNTHLFNIADSWALHNEEQ
jgi:hypothetical protein